MTDDEIIANQVRKIEELSETNILYEKSLRNIKMMLVSVGAPLNDNFLNYSNEQLKIFFEIVDEINNCI